MGWGQKRLSYLAHMFPAEVEQGGALPCYVSSQKQVSFCFIVLAFPHFCWRFCCLYPQDLVQASGQWSLVKFFFPPLFLEGMKVKSKTIALSFQIVLNN